MSRPLSVFLQQQPPRPQRPRSRALTSARIVSLKTVTAAALCPIRYRTLLVSRVMAQEINCVKLPESSQTTSNAARGRLVARRTNWLRGLSLVQMILVLHLHLCVLLTVAANVWRQLVETATEKGRVPSSAVRSLLPLMVRTKPMTFSSSAPPLQSRIRPFK